MISGKRFGGLGLRDLLVTAGIISEGSINAVLEGRHYNRAIRAHKICYEALSRLLKDKFEEWLPSEHRQLHHDFLDLLKTLNSDINQESVNDFIDNPVWIKWHELFLDFLVDLK